jgi:hypothetical protein
MRKKEIEELLRKALLENGKLEIALYEYELEKHIEDWYAGLQKDDKNLYLQLRSSRMMLRWYCLQKRKIFIQ